MPARDDKAEELASAWLELERILYKTQFAALPLATVANDFSKTLQNIKGVQATQITKIVYDKNEDSMAKLISVYSTMHSSDTPVFVLMNNTAKVTEFYIGVNNNDSGRQVTNKMRTLEFALQGNFPGLVYAPGNVQTAQQLSAIINAEQNKAVACLLGIPSLKTDKAKGFCQGLEKVIEALGPQEYIALLLATPVQSWELDQVEAGYQELSSILSMMNISQLSLNQQTSVAVGKAMATGLARTLSKNISRTNSMTRTIGKTVSHSETEGTAETDFESHTESKFSSNTVSTSFGTNQSVSVGSPGASASTGTFQSVGYAHTQGSGTADTHGHSTSHQHSVTEGISSNIGIARGIAESVSAGMSDTTSINISESLTNTTSQGSTISYTVHDRRIVEYLKLIDEQLSRVRTAKNYGGWNWGVYFLAKDATTAKSCADVFSGILRGEQTGIERCGSIVIEDSHHHNGESSMLENVKKALATFNHPLFQLPENEIIAATTLVTTPEIALGMSLPQKSLPSVPVFEIAEFGRAVTSMNLFRNLNKPSYRIGNIFHLGRDTDIPVELDVDSLCMHTFITGSTGSGKSNALYNILKKLYKGDGRSKQIPFLVIEPAKGEYKDIFGFLRDVNVFGTNPKRTNLLRINPFSFESAIHVMEHIDRLIEILNAAWPMYSAMPAILKDAVEKIYKQCGWDLLRSVNKYGMPVFPDFHDLLNALPDVIKYSGYSAEVTSNFTGALMTRVKSLTNGYYRTIFQKDELAAEELFDKPCIVDLSRVGSSETKSLLMGIVFMKLLEHRMANTRSGNLPLRHITVLEEAHNLLRRTSYDQISESANLTGKSVEMMTNAIAEMRTYGEGFIIADQAPGLLDQAVIRNTNTKIIFRLPDFQDRLLVGHAENLTDQQIDELARLKTGCASVFQNDWQEAVLCQFEKFNLKDLTQRTNPKFEPELQDLDKPDSRTLAKSQLLTHLLQILRNEREDNDLSEQEFKLYRQYYPELLQKHKIEQKQEKVSLGKFRTPDCRNKIQELIEIDQIERKLRGRRLTGNQWAHEVLAEIYQKPWVENLTVSDKKNLCSVVFQIVAELGPENYKEAWLKEAKKIEKWEAVILK